MATGAMQRKSLCIKHNEAEYTQITCLESNVQ